MLLCGLPGAGKSTLAAALAARLGAEVVASDRLRRELGLDGDYRPATVARVYDAMMARASALLRRGMPVVLDATFNRRAYREGARSLADRVGAPLAMVQLVADEATLLARLRARPADQAGHEAFAAVRRAFDPIDSDALTLDAGRRASAELVEEVTAYLTARQRA